VHTFSSVPIRIRNNTTPTRNPHPWPAHPKPSPTPRKNPIAFPFPPRPAPRTDRCAFPSRESCHQSRGTVNGTTGASRTPRRTAGVREDRPASRPRCGHEPPATTAPTMAARNRPIRMLHPIIRPIFRWRPERVSGTPRLLDSRAFAPDSPIALFQDHENPNFPIVFTSRAPGALRNQSRPSSPNRQKQRPAAFRSSHGRRPRSPLAAVRSKKQSRRTAVVRSGRPRSDQCARARPVYASRLLSPSQDLVIRQLGEVTAALLRRQAAVVLKTASNEQVRLPVGQSDDCLDVPSKTLECYHELQFAAEPPTYRLLGAAIQRLGYRSRIEEAAQMCGVVLHRHDSGRVFVAVIQAHQRDRERIERRVVLAPARDHHRGH